MRKLLGIALSCLAVAAAAGCDLLPDQEFDALRGALTLSVFRITPVGATQTRFDLALRNGGRARARACLGPGRAIFGASGVTMDLVHHPGCVREFELDSGGVLAWSETHEVTVEPERMGQVSVEIQILNPRRCSSVGCPEFLVESFRPTPTR